MRQDRNPARAQRRLWRFMASKTKMTRQKEKVPEKEGPAPPDSPLLDLSDAAVKKLIRTAKKRGYVTFEQINSLSKEVNSEQIEDVLAMFREMGVNVVETEEASEEEGSARSPRKRPKARAASWSGSSKRSRRSPRRRSRPSAPMIRCACICARWVRWNCSRAKARSPSPSASRPAARP